MTGPQVQVMSVLRAKGSATPIQVAVALNQRVNVVQLTLDALYRRNLATIAPSGRWCLTARGREKEATL